MDSLSCLRPPEPQSLRLRILRCASLALSLAAVSILLAVWPAPAQTWDMANTARPGQWTIYGRTASGGTLGMPSAAGDLNGDGKADVVLVPMNASSGPGKTRNRAGEVVVVLSSGAIGGTRDLALLDPAALPDDVVIVYGADALDFLGTEAWVSDFDADGIDDLLIGAQHGDGAANGRADCGEALIVWGRADLGGEVIDLATATTGLTRLYGADPGDRFGVWLFGGDFDGDGTADVIVGADQADGPAEGRTHAGETYIVYGGAALRAQTAVDMQSPTVPVTRIFGIDAEDHSGSTVRAGDMNGDGADEVVVGAGLNRLSASAAPNGSAGGHAIAGGDGPTGTRTDAGEAYVVYGQNGVRPATIDLAAPPSSTVVVYGMDAGDTYGEELFVGDFDGDGWGDLAIGALVSAGKDNAKPPYAGELAMVFGGPGLAGSAIDLATKPAGVTFFYGAAPLNIAGDTAFFADVDGDGRDDLFLASPLAAPLERFQAGIFEVFFGRDRPYPAEIDLAAVPSGFEPLVFQGAEEDDMLAYSAAYGDVDGDGLVDPVFNAMSGDGAGNLLTNAGDLYVVSGRVLSQAAGRFVPPHPDCPLDVDGSGAPPDVATDIVYVARHLLGLLPVPASFRAGGVLIPDDATLAARIDALTPALDVDGRNGTDVATDITYIARYLLGLSPVPASFRQQDATIPPNETIAAAIDALCLP